MAEAERVPGNREVPTLLLIRAQVLKESTDPGKLNKVEDPGREVRLAANFPP